ncbi:Mini-ribonuclease 3 [Streptococcus zalophi]|uniref:Mini-ribonuclease 3 n=1 Tax=Streptococcus zalophi TaxID=640031 RepID=A0A934UDW9_9STRE|nr:Mini-ribonuclease 3 [Streptococcus zalophi]MBJ8350251.1 Mini-ribonuclease 3 [Streptococcus zalophi]MCR8967505.1 Mini-ribonuclease 3 [Streptococcus zalophi]
MLDVNLINGIALAFEGDAVYSMYVRRHLIMTGQTKPNQLHRMATHYVSAKAQAMLINKLIDEKLLTDKEEDIYRRGRNATSNTKAKNTDVITYRMSTGFEAVIGYLHMTEQVERLEELIAWCFKVVEES